MSSSLSKVVPSWSVSSEFFLITIAPSSPGSSSGSVGRFSLWLSFVDYLLVEFCIKFLRRSEPVLEIETCTALIAVEIFLGNPINWVVQAVVVTDLEVAVVTDKELL